MFHIPGKNDFFYHGTEDSTLLRNNTEKLKREPYLVHYENINFKNEQGLCTSELAQQDKVISARQKVLYNTFLHSH